MTQPCQDCDVSPCKCVELRRRIDAIPSESSRRIRKAMCSVLGHKNQPLLDGVPDILWCRRCWLATFPKEDR